MRILHVNDFASAGGAEVIMHETVRLQRERGDEVAVWTGEELGSAGALTYAWNFGAARALRSHLAQHPVDVVHFHNVYHRLSPSVIAAAASAHGATGRPRLVMTAHDWHLLCPNPGGRSFSKGGSESEDVPAEKLRRLGTVLGRRWDHRSWSRSIGRVLQHVISYRVRSTRSKLDAVMAPGRMLAEALGDAGLTATQLPNPFDLAAAQAAARAETRPGPDKWTCVYAGRLAPEKGIVELIRHWPTDDGGQPVASLTVVGDGPSRRECEAARDTHDPAVRASITFAGQCSRDETMRAIARSHTLILPSVLRENAPSVLAEAIAVGTGVIASDRGGCREFMDETGIGIPIDVRDPESVAAAITAARGAGLPDVSTPAVRDFFAARSPERFIDRLDAIYRGTADGRSAAGRCSARDEHVTGT